MSVDSSKMPTHEPAGADHDEPYTWGLPPTMYVAPRQVARMMVLRSRIENRHALRGRVVRLPLPERASTGLGVSNELPHQG
jgi:hypothetical protein